MSYSTGHVEKKKKKQNPKSKTKKNTTIFKINYTDTDQNTYDVWIRKECIIDE